MKPTHKPGELIARVRERQQRVEQARALEWQWAQFLATQRRYATAMSEAREQTAVKPAALPLPWWRKWF